MEGNREFLGRPTHIQSIIFKREAKLIQWETTVFSINGAGTTRYSCVKTKQTNQKITSILTSGHNQKYP